MLPQSGFDHDRVSLGITREHVEDACYDVETGNEMRRKRRNERGSEDGYGEASEDGYGEASEDNEIVESENGNGSQDLEVVDGSQASEEDDMADTAWNVSCEVENYLSEGICLPEEQSLVWPPMLLVCIRGLDAKNEALGAVRECLVGKGLQAESILHTEFVCCEGNTFYDLFVLPPTGLSFAAAKAADGITKGAFTCYYPSLKDIVDIKNSRMPEFSRRFIPNLRYHGMDRQAWRRLRVDLLHDDGMCVARGLCWEVEPSDLVHGEVLDDLHVGVEVMDIVGDNSLSLESWKGSRRRWKTASVLHNGVSLSERLRQHTCSRASGSYCKDSEGDLNVQKAQAVLKDQLLTSVAPWVSSFEGDETFDSLSAERSKICQDALCDIESSSSQTFAKNDFEERCHGGLPFEEKLQNDEEIRMGQILVALTDASTKRVLIKRLATSNGFHLARGVVERLKVLHKMYEPATDSTTPINTMIKAAEETELSTLRSITEQVQLEKQQDSVLGGLETVGKEAILKLRELQHESLMKVLAETEATQISKLEEFVKDKFHFVSGIQKTKKETESIVDWLSQQIDRATYEINRSHMLEKSNWEARNKRSERVLEVARQRAEAKAASLEAQLEDQECARVEHERVASVLLVDKLVAERDAKALLVGKLEAENQAEKSKNELQAVMRELQEQMSAATCPICFEKLEGASGKKRNRTDVVLRKRGCFIPCMHASMCIKCSDDSWEKFKRCPVCNTACPNKPLPIFV